MAKNPAPPIPRMVLGNLWEPKTKETIGGNPLPTDAREKLGEFLDWLDVHYEVDNGVTALYWQLSYIIGEKLTKK